MGLRCTFGHNWTSLSCSIACRRCGKIKDAWHQWEGCLCKICGASNHRWNAYGCVKCGKSRRQKYWGRYPFSNKNTATSWTAH